MTLSIVLYFVFDEDQSQKAIYIHTKERESTVNDEQNSLFDTLWTSWNDQHRAIEKDCRLPPFFSRKLERVGETR